MSSPDFSSSAPAATPAQPSSSAPSLAMKKLFSIAGLALAALAAGAPLQHAAAQEATLALPTAQIAVMGAEGAVNAVYANKIAAIEDEDERASFVADKRREYDEDIDIVRLASELVVDDVVTPDALRGELVRRFRHYRRKDRHFSNRRHGVTPV